MTAAESPRPRQPLAEGVAGDTFQHGEAPAEPIEQNPIWLQDNVTLHSVGIDVGSSGTQVAFSRLHLRRLGEDLTSRYIVIRRETLFQSPVQLTPYSDGRRIDGPRLAAMVGEAYQAARQRPDSVDTGVVILTGEALRRDNAEQICGVLAAQGGELVCASAGHNMEAMLAAYGSGAARVSYERKARILNVDIGGGTTKLGLVENGRVIATAAVNIGGRLQVVGDDGRVVHLDPAGQEHAARAGFRWSLGARVATHELDRVASTMADALVAAIAERPVPAEVRGLFLTEPLGGLGHLDGIMFSGGVAEYVYSREVRDFGDLGRRLGAALRARLETGALPAPLLPAGECIRATVLGASEYSVQLSGSTSYISRPDALLPRRNLQVIRPECTLDERVDPDAVAEAIRRHLAAFDLDGVQADVAVAFAWDGVPSYDRIVGFARGIARGLGRRIEAGLPLYLLLDGDVALTLGGILREDLEVGSELLVIDGLRLWDFDYIDLGRLREPSNTVAVTIKSLVFNNDPRV
ncbi:MAG: ethanolamine ammonia-lyase reactivating factor EutA [Streptomycetales bacterium]